MALRRELMENAGCCIEWVADRGGAGRVHQAGNGQMSHRTHREIVPGCTGGVRDVHYTRHRFRQLRKMGGCCIGAPEDWNYAKQAELRDTVPNRIDL